MSEVLSVLSGRPLIQEYAQGRAADSIGEIAEFIAPGVDTATHTGKYKMYDSKNRFKIPDTLRGIGGKATRLEFSKTDANFDCSPHALDVPLDNVEIDEAEGENLLMEAADEASALGGMAHESEVIDAAVAGATANGTLGNWSNAAKNPVDELNQMIVAAYLAAGGYPSIEVGVVMDPTALRLFFANTKTQAYFPGAKSIPPSIENIRTLLMGNNQVRTSWLAVDTAAAGKAATMAFKLASTVLVFARSSRPTRRDPSFMKTFRPRGRWMVPGTYQSEDGRGEVVKMDWSQDVQVTNTGGAGQKATIS